MSSQSFRNRLARARDGDLVQIYAGPMCSHVYVTPEGVLTVRDRQLFREGKPRIALKRQAFGCGWSPYGHGFLQLVQIGRVQTVRDLSGNEVGAVNVLNGLSFSHGYWEPGPDGIYLSSPGGIVRISEAGIATKYTGAFDDWDLHEGKIVLQTGRKLRQGRKVVGELRHEDNGWSLTAAGLWESELDTLLLNGEVVYNGPMTSWRTCDYGVLIRIQDGRRNNAQVIVEGHELAILLVKRTDFNPDAVLC